MRGYIVGVLTYKWTDKLTQALETDHVFDPEILGYGSNPYVPHSAAYHGFVQLVPLRDHAEGSPGSGGVKSSGTPTVWRPANADNYHEITLGLIYKPKDHIWIRPEVRYDWSQFTHPYNDGTRNSQLTMGFDVIFLF